MSTFTVTSSSSISAPATGNVPLGGRPSPSLGAATAANTSTGLGSGLVGPDGERYIWVMDPMTRKLKVPLSLIDPTQATATPGTVPSLCMLFLDGKCKYPACRQVHISLPVLQHLRQEAQSAPTCCSLHGDMRDNSALVTNFELVSIVANAAGSPVPSAGGNSPVPSDVVPPPLPPPMYGSSPAKQLPTQREGGSPVQNQEDSPVPSATQFPALPGNTIVPQPAAWGGGNGASISPSATASSVGNATSRNTSLQSITCPSQPQREVLLTLPSHQVAMTVGLQRFLAQSGYIGNTPVPSTRGNSPVEELEHQPVLVSEHEHQQEHQPLQHGGEHDADDQQVMPAPNSVLEIPVKMICRLHLSHKCRYLEDCNNVHICRDYDGKLPASSAGSNPTLGPQHSQEVLQGLRAKVSSTHVGSVLYNVSAVSPGQVTDTEMHQIVQAHKMQHPTVQLRVIDVRTAPAAPPAAAAGPVHAYHDPAVPPPPPPPQYPGPNISPGVGSYTAQPTTTKGGTSPFLSSTTEPPPPPPPVSFLHAASSDEPVVYGAPDWGY